jgi:NAD-dependent deacetylase
VTVTEHPFDSDAMDGVRALLRDASSVVILSGAGVSAESGVPTFRGPGGLWRSHRPEELATPGAFRGDPRLVWEWYAWRRERVSECAPNPGHRAVAAWQLARSGVYVVTQNVDGLHERAMLEALGETDGGGAPRPEVLPLELHGSLFRVRCTQCSYRQPHRGPVDASSLSTLPTCPRCASLLRPDVVWFGEALDPRVLSRAFELARRADVCLVVGTSAVVHPAASVPLATLEGGGRIVEVNPDPTPLSESAWVAIRGPSGEVLPALLSSDARGG